MRRLILLGSTGSIGVSTLEVVAHLASSGLAQFEVAGIAAHSNHALLSEQARRFRVPAVAICKPADGMPGASFTGESAAIDLIHSCARPGDLVVGAMVGAAGIAPTLAAIEMGCHIALANKETLVAAGGLVTAAAARAGIELLAVDSEHSAVQQCLRSSQGTREVRRVVLTASGGPFRTATIEEMAAATPAQALRHPTWSMGRKVTIDSATMMNKALELIEAHWLFGLGSSQLEAVIHPQSMIHSFVEFVDGSTIAQLSPPDMKLPIQCALTWPARLEGCARRTDFGSLGALQFSPIDHERFPAVSLAHRVIECGGTAGAILNGANEVAVEAFLQGRISFPQISQLTADALDGVDATEASSLGQVMKSDAAARAFVLTNIEATA